MPEHVVTVLHTYPATVVPRGARKPVVQAVAARAAVALREVDPGDLPPALAAEVVGRWDFTRPALPVRALELRGSDDGLVAPLLDREGRPVAVGSLAAGYHAPEGWGEAFDAGTWSLGMPEEKLADRVRTVIETGAAAKAAQIAGVAARCRVAGGHVFVPAEEPVWSVSVHARPEGHDDLLVAACLPSAARDGAACFRADDLDGALAYGEWLAAEHRAATAREARPRRAGAIEVLAPQALTLDMAALNAARLIDRADRDGGGAEFARLPVTALRAWADFKEAVPSHREGDRAATAACVLALARVFDSLPGGAGRSGHGTDFVLASPRLHAMLHPLRYLAPLLVADLAPEPLDPEDEAALAL